MKTSQRFEICYDAKHEKGSSSKMLIRKNFVCEGRVREYGSQRSGAMTKKLRIRIRNDILERSGREPTGLNNVIAGDGQ
jgi:hypothetical protein